MLLKGILGPISKENVAKVDPFVGKFGEIGPICREILHQKPTHLRRTPLSPDIREYPPALVLCFTVLFYVRVAISTFKISVALNINVMCLVVKVI